MNSEDLKGCRLVSSTWNDEATPIFGKKTVFPVIKYGIDLFKSDHEIQFGLVKNAKVLVENPNENIDLHGKTLLDFGAQYGDKIREIEFTVVPTFSKWINSVFNPPLFSRVTKISFNVLDEYYTKAVSTIPTTSTYFKSVGVTEKRS
jgi:hypothetical protein